MRPPIPRCRQRLFWLAVRSGLAPKRAAVSIGVSENTGWRWFTNAGGVSPMPLSEPPAKPRYLGLEERERILEGLARGESYSMIAEALGRAVSTITRELRLHRVDSRRPAAEPVGRKTVRRGPVATRLNYSPSVAHAAAEAVRARPKTGKLAGYPPLQAEVQSRLTNKHSPEQIAGRLRLDFPDDPEMWVSHETIYQSIYIQAHGGLKRELSACLRTGRQLRKPRRPAVAKSPRSGGVSISQRPPEAADRAVPGHFEGDLIIGARTQSAIATIVERRSRYTLLGHLPTAHTAAEVSLAVAAALRRLPDQVKAHTLTWDQGSEMADHANIAVAAGVKIFFCDPASPWQRPSNENTNGLLRQYFPKGTDLSVHSANHLQAVATELNNRPRKCLSYRTPAEVFYETLLSTPPTLSVASTT